MLANAFFPVKFDVDTAENGPSKVCQETKKIRRNIGWDPTTVENFETAARSFTTLTDLCLARNALENEAVQALSFAESV